MLFSFRFSGRNAERENGDNSLRHSIETQSVEQSIAQCCQASNVSPNFPNFVADSNWKLEKKIQINRLIDLTITSDEEEVVAAPAKKPRVDDDATAAASTTDDAFEPKETSSSKIKLSPAFKKIINTSPIVKLKKISNSDQQAPERRYPVRVRRPPVNLLAGDDRATSTSKDKQEKKHKKKTLQLEDMYNWSECLVALEHDRKYNFFPQPGPSYINNYENVSLPGYYAPIDDDIDNNQSDFDIQLESLYETSILYQSPVSQTTHSPDPLFNISDADDDPLSVSPFQISTPLLHSIKANFRVRNPDSHIVTPVTITPTAETLLLDLINYDLPQVVSKTPFYSNCDDATNVREVGNHILRIPNLTECDTFESSLITTGLNAWRRNIYTNIMSMDDKEKLQNKSLDEIREFFAVQKRTVIIPSRCPPSVRQAELWLNNKRDTKDVIEPMDVDSPIKVRRERAKIIVENGNGDDDEDSECDVSLSCSPLAVLANSQDSKLINKHLTKVTNRSIKAKKSLNSTFDELKKSGVVRESPNMFSADSESPTHELIDSDEEIPSSQVITIKHLRSKNNSNNNNSTHLNGHTESTKNCMSDSSPLVNSVS